MKWAGKSEVLAMLDNQEFITYYRSFIELLFDSCGNYGSHESEELK